MSVSARAVEAHLDAFVEVLRRWQRDGEARFGGGLPCPVARVPLQWTEFFALPVALDRLRRAPDDGRRALVLGLVDFLAAVQREDGTFDAGFCGDLCQPCNAAFALRPLATAFSDWPDDLDAERRARLRALLARAADAAADGGMNTANHRWVAAGGLAHASAALGRDDLGRAADDWTRAGIDVDEDGAFSEGSPKYALVSDDALLDLEALRGRSDLGSLARRSLRYLRATSLPDGELVAVGSARYDTDGSSDGYARAACVFARLGDAERAHRALAHLWTLRTAPGLVAPCATPPLGAHPKAKLYPSVTSALTAEHLLRWLRLPAPDPPPAADPEASGHGGTQALGASGLLVHRAGRFAAAAAPGPNLLEVRQGRAVIEAVRVLGHATGWNRLYAVEHVLGEGWLRLVLSAAPGSAHVRLPQFHRDEPGRRRPGRPVPAIRGSLEIRLGPGPSAALDLHLEGPAGAHALLELGARPDQALFDRDGVRQRAPYAPPADARTVVAGAGADRLLVHHQGGSGHALQVAPYGYGDGDALWAPSFAPRAIRIGLTLPARLRVGIRPG